MKKYYVCFFFFCLFFLCLSFPFVEAQGPLKEKSFVIDVGHGGVDPGTVVGSIYEKDINLRISKFLKKELEHLGASVLLIREGDYDLASPLAMYRKKSDFDHRISLINHSKANYFISIHLNYLEDSSYDGAQVFYSKVLDENKTIAEKVQAYLNQKLQTKRESKKISSSIYMYPKLKIPGVLVECGFLSNAKEREKLQDDAYLSLFAKYLAESFLTI